jgi:Flp pilus assembly protein TadG
MRRRLGAVLGSFARARDGNIAVIFALTALPLVIAVGGALDYGFCLSNKSVLQSASDAAALGGAQAANTYMSQNGTASAQVTKAISVGNTAAQAIFSANITAIGSQTTALLTSATTVSSSAPTVVVTAKSTYTPFLLKLVGIKSIPLTVSSTTTMSPSNSYYQIIFVVDVSGSMAVGGNSTTISNMENSAAFYNCAFACHDPNNLNGQGDLRALAKSYGYQLKIDYVNTAIQSFMNQLVTYSNKFPGRYTVGIDTFATLNNFQILLNPTTNISAAATAASKIDVEAVTGPVAVTNWGWTYTTSGLASALSNITNMGNGSSPTKMVTYVIFLTDGVEDIPGNQIYGRQADLNYVSECTALKNAGVNMFTIWAPYYNIPNDNQYNILVAPLSSQLPTTMQSCASNPNQYFQANDGQSITAAVNSTFNTIIANSKLRLSN